MNTRYNRKFISGFYKQLSSGGLLDESENSENSQKYRSFINIDALIKSINYNVLSKLYSSRKLSPTISFKVNINSKIFQYLKETYNFDSKYKESSLFVSNNKIKTSRCTNIKYYRVAQNFHFKINKGRSLKYSEIRDNQIFNGLIKSEPTLSVQFLRICKP